MKANQGHKSYCRRRPVRGKNFFSFLPRAHFFSTSSDLLRLELRGYFGHQYQPFRRLSNRGDPRIVDRIRTNTIVRYSDTIEPKSMAPIQAQSSISTGNSRAAAIEHALRTIIRGNDEVLRLALVSVLARGHLLIEGVPGVGKTTLAHTMARALDCTFQRLQFTSDMLPSDVLGISVYSAAEGQFEFKAGPVFTNVLLADEINRTTPKTQSALLEAMNEGQVTMDGHSHPLPQPFLVIATQNPIEHHGTYPLPESQLDRFLLRVRMGYPQGNNEREILRSEAGAARLDSVKPVATGADIIAMQDEVTQVKVDDSLVDYALEIVKKTREIETLSLGVSPRGSLMLYRAAQAMAYLEGRRYATPADFKSLVVPVFSHRVVVNARYSSTLKKSDQGDNILHDIVQSVAVPV
jgi:MoxR-like ATPase